MVVVVVVVVVFFFFGCDRCLKEVVGMVEVSCGSRRSEIGVGMAEVGHGAGHGTGCGDRRSEIGVG